MWFKKRNSVRKQLNKLEENVFYQYDAIREKFHFLELVNKYEKTGIIESAWGRDYSRFPHEDKKILTRQEATERGYSFIEKINERELWAKLDKEIEEKTT